MPVAGMTSSPSGMPAPTPPVHVTARRWPRRVVYVAVAAVLGGLVAAQGSVLVESIGIMGHLHWAWVPLVLLADFASRAAVARTHRRLLRAGGTRLSQHAALQVVYASNAMSVTLPVAGAQLGAAFTFKRFTQAGATTAATAWTLLVSGIAATSSFAVLLAVGALATRTAGGVVIAIGGALLAALPGWVVIVGLHTTGGRRRLQAVLTRGLGLWRRLMRTQGPTPQTVVQDLLDQLTVLRLPPRDRLPLVLLALTNWLVDCLCLAAAIRAVGAPIPWQGLLLAYLTAAGATTLAVTPGGLGTVEIALTAALIAAGLDAPHALAATLLYRLASLWIPAIGGWVTYAVLAPHKHAGP